jgi:hypothetical protein
MEAQQQRMQAEAEERAQVQKYYGLASDAMERGDMQGVISNVSRASPGTGFNMAFQLHQNKLAQEARAAESQRELQARSEDKADSRKFEMEKIAIQHQWRQEDMRLQKALAGAQIAASRAAGMRPEYKTDSATGEVMAIIGDKAFPVKRGDGKTVKSTVAGIPVGSDGNLEVEAPQGYKAQKMPKAPGPAQLLSAQKALGEATDISAILREQEVLHGTLMKQYGDGGAMTKLLQKKDALLGNNNELNQYIANQNRLVQIGLAMQKGPQTDADFERELSTYAQASNPGASAAAILARIKLSNERTINNYSAYIQGYALVPEGKGVTEKQPESGNVGSSGSTVDWKDYQ